MNIQECFDKRILRRIIPDKLKSESSFNVAENKFTRASELLKKDFLEEAFVSAYTSMFHAARAILYKEGVQEKSYYAVYIYLSEKHKSNFSKGLIEAFKVYQLERHEIMYGFEPEINIEKVESAIENAELFIQQVRKIL